MSSASALAEANTALVPFVLSRCIRRMAGAREAGATVASGQTRKELMGAGYLGLMRAARCFDPAHGCSFSSYAVPAIHRAMIEQIAQERAGLFALTNMVGRKDVLAALPRTISLDASLSELSTAPRELADAVASTEGADTLEDLLADAPENRPETQIVHREAQRALWSAVSSVLTAREAEVVALHYRGVSGESDDTDLNLSEIAVRLGTTRQNVHDTHMRALRKLRQRLPGEVLKEIIAA